MPEIREVDFKDILTACNTSETYPNLKLPRGLFYYLVNYISYNAFKDKNDKLDTKAQFDWDSSIFERLTEDKRIRIFG